MIAPVHKYLLIGIEKDLKAFLRDAQERECLQCCHPRAKALPREAKLIQRALKEISSGSEGGDLEDEVLIQLAGDVVALVEQLDKLREEDKELIRRLDELEPLGNFFESDIALLGWQVQIFCQRRSQIAPEQLIHLGRDRGMDYYLSVASSRLELPNMLEIELDKDPGQLRDAHRVNQKAKSAALKQLEMQSNCFIPLQQLWWKMLDEAELVAAQQGHKPLLGTAFSMEVWIPDRFVQVVEDLLRDRAISAMPVGTEAGERIPTDMSNTKLARLGQDLVQLYDLPSPEDFDPSYWVIVSFLLFFSMIIADGGYGLIMLLTALWQWRRVPQDRMRQLAVILALSCFCWGVINCSFFGIRLPPESFLRCYSLPLLMAKCKASYHLQRCDVVAVEWIGHFPHLRGMNGGEFLRLATVGQGLAQRWPPLEQCIDAWNLEFSLLIGIVHLCTSLLCGLRRNWSAIGWVACLWGTYLALPVVIGTTSCLHVWVQSDLCALFGQQLLISGSVVVVVLALLQRSWRGIAEVANAIQLFIDVLSYLRLYALSMAGGMMAATFNELGWRVGLFFGFALTLCGHAINLTLAVMGGVIHGLRLNFIEWYHYSFIGGGRLFTPLRRRRK